MKIMISQPMRGKTEEQIRTERAELIKKLESEGHTVVDTIFAEGMPEGDARLYYLAKSIEAMSKVDAVVFMPGWEDARGCIKLPEIKPVGIKPPETTEVMDNDLIK